MNEAEQVNEIRRRGEEIIVLLRDTTIDIGIISCLEASVKMLKAVNNCSTKEALGHIVQLAGRLSEADKGKTK